MPSSPNSAIGATSSDDQRRWGVGVNELGGATWVEVAARPPSLLVVPIGSVEQHGPHLPLNTDTRIATAVATEVATRVGAMVAPPIAFGASGEHAGFPGTLSVGLDALESMVVELIRSADHFDGVVLVNGHGGNGVALRSAVAISRHDGRRALLTHCGSIDADAHAGRAETSLLLHLCPDVVRLDQAQAGVTAPWAEVAERVRADGVAAVSPNGVLGDPSGATAEEGARRFAEIVERIMGEVAGWAGG
jgi:mycofactocin system creatininase family protein